MNLVSKLFTFRGRSGRQEYWCITLGILLFRGIFQLLLELSDQSLVLRRMGAALLLVGTFDNRMITAQGATESPNR